MRAIVSHAIIFWQLETGLAEPMEFLPNMPGSAVGL
jgi:hypothetical protein